MKLAGRTVAGMSLISRLGKGGMGEVWRAYDHENDREVALKLLLPNHPESSPGLLRSFLKEGRSNVRLRHRHIVHVLRAGRAQFEDGIIRYIAMELVEGHTVEQLLPPHVKKLPAWETVAKIGLACAEALHYAHLRGIIHCDVKPANVLRSSDGTTIKLADFGLARIGPTHSQSPSGTPLYISPEVWRGEEATPSSDCYSLGVMLAHLASGDAPLTGSDEESVLSARLEKQIELKFPNIDGVPAGFTEVLQSMVAMASSSRPPLSKVIEEFARLLGKPKDELSLNSESAVEHIGLRSHTHAYFPDFDALNQCKTMLGSGASVVTVHGPAGIGKTRFAEEFIRGVRSDLAAVCDLSSATTLSDCIFIVAQTLNARLASGDPIERLIEILNERGKLLLVLNNAEQVAEALVDLLVRLREACGQLQLIVTSRVLLNIEDELVVTLKPMTHESGANSRAKQLFTARAREVAPQVNFTDSHQVLDELLACLEGIPLAIELAASQLAFKSVEEILQGLRGNARSSLSDAMVATIDWSWRLLDHADRAVLLQASLFAGGFSLEAAEDVVEEQEGRSTFDVLESLVEAGLVYVREEQDFVDGFRYYAFQSVLEYCRGRRQREWTDDTSQEMEVRHGTHFLRKCGAIWNGKTSKVLTSSDYATLAQEFDNLVAGLTRCSRHTPELSAGLSVPLYVYLMHASHAEQALPYFKLLYPFLNELSPDSLQPEEGANVIICLCNFTDIAVFTTTEIDRDALLATIDRLFETQDTSHSDFPTIVRMRCSAFVKVLNASGRFEPAVKEIESCRRLLEDNGHEGSPELGRILRYLGHAYRQYGQIKNARFAYESASALLAKNFWEYDATACRLNLAGALIHLNELEYAYDKAIECLHYFIERNEEVPAMAAYRYLSTIELHRGNFEESLELIDRALDASTRVGVQSTRITIAVERATVLRKLERHEDAKSHLSSAIDSLAASNTSTFAWQLHRELSITACCLDDDAAVQKHMAAAKRCYSNGSVRHLRLLHHLAEGYVAYRFDGPLRALEILKRALAEFGDFEQLASIHELVSATALMKFIAGASRQEVAQEFGGLIQSMERDLRTQEDSAYLALMKSVEAGSIEEFNARLASARESVKKLGFSKSSNQPRVRLFYDALEAAQTLIRPSA